MAPKNRRWELPVCNDTHPHWAPASVKLAVKSAQQLEVKVKYQSGPRTKDQQVYSVSMYVFIPEQLSSVKDDVYGHLSQDVRLHTPKVPLASLRTTDGGGFLTEGFKAQLQQLLETDEDNSGSGRRQKQAKKESAAIVRSAIQALRLHACVFRTSLRRATKQLLAEVKVAEADNMGSVSKGIAGLVFDVCGVVQHFDQVARNFALPQLPEELQEEFALIDEFLLFEADRALMKLLRGVDKRLSGSELSARPPSTDLDIEQEPPPPRPDSTAMKRSLSSLARSAQKIIASAATVPRTESQQRALSSQEMSEARHTLGAAIMALEDARAAQGFWESIMRENDEHQNEDFTYRLKLLKKNVRRAIRLAPKTETPSFWFADLIGSIVAATAMAVACATIVFAQFATKGTRYTLVFSVILVVGYVVKDRMKEWGKRYLEPLGSSMGVHFPDRIRKLHDYSGKVVGRCEEKAEVVGPGKVPQLVLDFRHADKAPLKSKHPGIQPERVIQYKKEIKVSWAKLGKQLQYADSHDGLDDVMLLDLSFLTQRMQPAVETHHKLWTTGEGSFGIEKMRCARSYHVNVVLRVKSLAKGADDRTMVMQRARVVMDKINGIKRIENSDSIDMHKAVLLRRGATAMASTIDRLSVAARHGLRAGTQQGCAAYGSGGHSGSGSGGDRTARRLQTEGNGESVKRALANREQH